MTAQPGGLTTTVTGTNLTATIAGPMRGVRYTFTVQATNGVGAGPFSGSSAVRVSAATRAYTFSGPVNGAAYTFTVTAVTATGTGPPSAPTPAVVPSV